MLSIYYILDGKDPVKSDKETFDKWWPEAFAKGETKVKDTRMTHSTFVLTTFRGINHNPFKNGKPHLFLTQVLVDGEVLYLENFSTWLGAEGGHDRIVKKFKEGTLLKI